jgi:hypothetical protein
MWILFINMHLIANNKIKIFMKLLVLAIKIWPVLLCCLINPILAQMTFPVQVGGFTGDTEIH